MSAQSVRSFTPFEVEQYCKYSIDINPIHHNAEASLLVGYNDILVPGLLISSLWGGLMGSVLPGFGTIHLYQDVQFLKPILVNESVKAIIKITHIRSDKPIVTFDCIAYNSKNDIVQKGKSVVKVPTQYL